jgi:hypothetical protein
MEIVEIKCKDILETHKCIAYGLKIVMPNFRVVSVKAKGKTRDRTELVISDQQILFLPLNLSSFFPNMVKFTVTNSQLVEISHEAFIGLDGLKEISFRSNRIAEVRQFRELQLTKLDLSHNQIESIDSSTFALLQNLEEIWLNNNLLTRIMGKIFVMNKNLRVVHLQSNRISQIASNFLDFLVKVEYLDLTNNVCIDSKFPGNSLDSITKNLNEKCNVDIDFECRFEVNSEKDYVCYAENVE